MIGYETGGKDVFTSLFALLPFIIGNYTYIIQVFSVRLCTMNISDQFR